MRKLLLLFSLCLAFFTGCTPVAFAQASPYNLNIYKAQSFIATGQTGSTIQLNGLVIPSTIGSSYASGTITLTGTAITTVSFQVMGSSDNGATYYALPVFTVANPGTSPVGQTPTFIATGTGSGITFTPVQALTLDSIGIVSLGTQGAACTTPPVLSVFVAGSVSACSTTIANGTFSPTPGSCSIAVSAGQTVAVKVSTASAGCTTSPANATAYLQYH